MKVNSMDSTPQTSPNFAGLIFLGLVGGFIAFIGVTFTLYLGTNVTIFIYTYWHLIILGIIVLLFLKRWFFPRKKEINPVPQGVDYG